jgi:hypothetical protein
VILQAASLVLAIAKALPVLERLLDAVERQRVEERRQRQHKQIDDAIIAAQQAPRVCHFADCPLGRGLPSGAP